MKNIFLFVVLCFVVSFSFSQSTGPVNWLFSVKKTGANTYQIIGTATIGKGWHLYSQTTPDGGPIPTAVSFNKNPIVTMLGAVKEVGLLEVHNEPLFGVEVKQYSDKVDFVQTVKVKPGIKTNISGTVAYMLCNNKECLPPAQKTFLVELK